MIVQYLFLLVGSSMHSLVVLLEIICSYANCFETENSVLLKQWKKNNHLYVMH